MWLQPVGVDSDRVDLGVVAEDTDGKVNLAAAGCDRRGSTGDSLSMQGKSRRCRKLVIDDVLALMPS